MALNTAAPNIETDLSLEVTSLNLFCDHTLKVLGNNIPRKDFSRPPLARLLALPPWSRTHIYARSLSGATSQCYRRMDV